MAELSDREVQERVAILKRFKELLEKQREKFRSYLDVLDREKADIERSDVDKLVAHVEIEEQVVSEIFAFQKAINPMEEIYQAVYPHDEGEVPAIKTTVEELKTEVLKRNEENRALLKQRMEILRQEIVQVRAQNPYANKRSVYADEGQAGLIDIKG